MNGPIDAERILDAFLAPESDRLPDRVIDAALADIARTPQRRALRVPWRFSDMPAFTRATSIAAVALVAVVGAGTLFYLTSNRPGGSGSNGQPTPNPSQTPAPSATAADTPAPSWEARTGIPDWTAYTSEVYGITFGYPEPWQVEAPATRTWQPGDPIEFGDYTDVLISPDNDIAFAVLRMPAESGADIGSREGLGAFICEQQASLCEAISDLAEPMCLGKDACLPAVVLPRPINAYFADTETRMVTVVYVGRQDSFPGAAQYGGTVELLKSILTTMDVWTPEPGQVPG